MRGWQARPASSCVGSQFPSGLLDCGKNRLALWFARAGGGGAALKTPAALHVARRSASTEMTPVPVRGYSEVQPVEQMTRALSPRLGQ